MNFTKVLSDIREVEAEEAQQAAMSVDALCEQIRRQPDRHATLVALIKAVEQYAADSSADTSEVVVLLNRAVDACADVYVVRQEVA